MTLKTENKQLLHQVFIEVASFYPPLSNLEHQVHYKEESDLESDCIDDMEKPQPVPTFL